MFWHLSSSTCDGSVSPWIKKPGNFCSHLLVPSLLLCKWQLLSVNQCITGHCWFDLRKDKGGGSKMNPSQQTLLFSCEPCTQNLRWKIPELFVCRRFVGCPSWKSQLWNMICSVPSTAHANPALLWKALRNVAWMQLQNLQESLLLCLTVSTWKWTRLNPMP